jgi:fatty acid desaturase
MLHDRLHPPLITSIMHSRSELEMTRFLNDPRDLPHLRLIIQCSLVFIPAATLLYALPGFPWWLGAAYIVLWLLFGDRFTMSYHCLIHRRLFKTRYPALEIYLNWILCPFLGQAPGTFYIHHMGMHHIDDNLPRDLSSTMGYQRDSAWDFLRYYLRFACLMPFELTAYLWRTGKAKLVWRFLAGEFGYLGVVIAAGFWNLPATLVVFVLPLVFVRLMMMLGNWVQHSFVDPDHPEDLYKCGVNTIDPRYNARLFNAGYHIFHHIRKGTHFTELATEFEQNREKYGRQDAVVFDGIDLPAIGILLLTRQHRKLARHFVRLPGAPQRSDDEVIALFRRRLAPIRNWTPAPASAARVV